MARHPALLELGCTEVGIHNVWDSTTYIVFVRRQEQQERGGGETP